MNMSAWRKSSLVVGVALALGTGLEAAEKKVLMLTKSSGFEHPVVRRHGNQLSQAERIVVELGKKHGFDVTASKDCSQINADNLKKYHCLFLFTQGEIDRPGLDKQPPVAREDRQAILDFVAAGGGFVGTHCGGADTFHAWTDGKRKPFLEMVGGEFIGHGRQQPAQVVVVDPHFPAMKPWGDRFSLNDEWYAYRGFQPKMHVLMMLQTSGMEGKDYQREPYPITWCSLHGEGRVFYTGLGHREDVWDNPKYQAMVAAAVRWALKEIDGDASPNLASLFGDVERALVRINPPR